MAVRAALNTNKATGLFFALALLAFVGAALAYEMWPVSAPFHVNESYYSDDDGRTWFMDTIYKFPPFDHNGKTANRAIVFKSEKGDFVGYLLRYKPAAVKKLADTYEEAKAGKRPMADVARTLASDPIRLGGQEFAYPLTNKWVALGGQPPAVKSPDGSAVEMMVMP